MEQVEVYCLKNDREEKQVAVLGAGDFFRETALLEDTVLAVAERAFIVPARLSLQGDNTESRAVQVANPPMPVTPRKR